MFCRNIKLFWLANVGPCSILKSRKIVLNPFVFKWDTVGYHAIWSIQPNLKQTNSNELVQQSKASQYCCSQSENIIYDSNIVCLHSPYKHHLTIFSLSFFQRTTTLPGRCHGIQNNYAITSSREIVRNKSPKGPSFHSGIFYISSTRTAISKKM